MRLTGWLVPSVLLAAYGFLIYTMNASMAIALLSLAGLGCVLVIWFVFRELAAHAAITRAIAIGEPDEVVSRARSAIDHRLTRRGQVPFRIYEAIGLGLRGEWERSRAAIAEVDPTGAGWRLLAAVTRIAAATELADPDAARAAMEDVTLLHRRLGPPVDLTVRECQARVRFACGDLVDAWSLFEALVDEVRLGPAPRAAALYYAGCCDEDPARARTYFERARGLAPKTWVKAAAEARLGASGSVR
jgi:hypothetical protein